LESPTFTPDIHRGIRRDHRRRDRRARFLDRGDRPIHARLEVELARGRDEESDVARAHQLDDPLAHHLAGKEELLADIGEPPVRAPGRCVGVVAEHRDAARAVPAIVASTEAAVAAPIPWAIARRGRRAATRRTKVSSGSSTIDASPPRRSALARCPKLRRAREASQSAALVP
jgi:hypothetical protein